MKVLVTGGAGYIGSHTCLELLESGHEVIVVDNLINSNKISLQRVEELTGKSISFYELNVLNAEKLDEIFKQHNVDAVIHFAGLKAVGESVSKPLEYYDNNLTSTIILCRVMSANNVKNIAFSSSATVYGDPATVPITEDFPLSSTNPYGNSKLFIEYILKDLHTSDKAWNVELLRYFNPVGAHKSGRIGEAPNDVPNNLMPYVSQIAVGKLKELSVFGNDYPTPDGTGVRDYIHVVDLALGHIKAIEKLATKPGVVTYNLGTGAGYSVLDLVKGFEMASNRKIPYKIVPRRPGDIAICYADSAKAKNELGWQATRGIKEMCEDTWRWQSDTPDGYK